MTSLKDKLRGSTSLSKIKEELEKLNSKGTSDREEDSRFWTLTVDAAGNGEALIRFLPAPEGEDVPWVKIYTHGFQGPGGWYVENSLTTINQKDPVSEYNKELWDSGIEANKNIVRQKQKRKLSYISNILVVKDPGNPENDGKVFLFRYGAKIFEKIQGMIDPQTENKLVKAPDPRNPFCPFEGCDFHLSAKVVAEYRNYDSSAFQPASPLFGGDEDKIVELWKKANSLTDFISPDKFKSYDQLSQRLQKVLGTGARTTVVASSEPARTSIAQTVEAASASSPEPVSEGDLEYLSKLAEGDD